MALYDRVVIAESGCHLWTGGVDSHGYGQMRVSGRVRLVHRHSWEEHHGVILDRSQLIHHECHQPLCVNVEHLRVMTKAAHNREHASESAIGLQRGKTHCPKSHVYDAENTRHTGKQRVCRKCERERAFRRVAEGQWRVTGG